MTSRTPELKQVVRWTFKRESEMLTCVVHGLSRTFRVSLVPHSRGGRSAVRSCRSLQAALRAHAGIAAALRDEGWDVISYTHTPPSPETRPRAVANAA
jgi:hypothetical protein